MGLAAIALIWFVFIPVLTGGWHTAAIIILVFVSIVWLLTLAEVIG